jgi:hypothetical protein
MLFEVRVQNGNEIDLLQVTGFEDLVSCYAFPTPEKCFYYDDEQGNSRCICSKYDFHFAHSFFKFGELELRLATPVPLNEQALSADCDDLATEPDPLIKVEGSLAKNDLVSRRVADLETAVLFLAQTVEVLVADSSSERVKQCGDTRLGKIYNLLSYCRDPMI